MKMIIWNSVRVGVTALVLLTVPFSSGAHSGNPPPRAIDETTGQYPELLSRRVVAFQGIIIGKIAPTGQDDHSGFAVVKCLVETTIYGSVADTIDILVNNYAFTTGDGRPAIHHAMSEPWLMIGDHVVVICCGKLDSALDQENPSRVDEPVFLVWASVLMPIDFMGKESGGTSIGAFHEVQHSPTYGRSTTSPQWSEKLGIHREFALQTTDVDSLRNSIRTFYEGNKSQRVAACD